MVESNTQPRLRRTDDNENDGSNTARLDGIWQRKGSGTLAGAVVALIASVVAGYIAAGRSWGPEVPLAFSIVLLVVAALFGTGAGLVGTVLSALVFATQLFNPLGNYHVESGVARTNLGWMILIGITFSFLFAPQKNVFRRE